MIMAAAGLLKKNPKPTDADIDAEITNICRCGTYNRVREAIKLAASGLPAKQSAGGIDHEHGIHRFRAVSFLIGSASAIGGLSLGFHVPFAEAAPATAASEVNVMGRDPAR